jgi:two-component system sensor histidine kinase QseC
VLALLVWIAITRGLRPLARLGEQVAAREPANLAALDAGEAPAEVAPLADKLNKLFERVRSSMENEQRFTADAAHELRTPLAAIRAQAQVARASSADVERNHALDRVVLGCDRASHLVDQLLTLARIDAAPANRRFVPVDLRAVASAVIADLAPAAIENGIEIDLSEGAAAQIAGEPALVRILVSNLVDNAVRYSPPGGKVRVDVATVAERPTLTVIDQGPGIPAEQRERVWQRFFRIPGNAAEGSGLGLSIVERVAQLHGAAVTLADGENGSGLRVTVVFPRSHLPSLA